jgi:hypothetical protein
MIVAAVPIVLAGIASTLIGWVWYSPHVFGGVWMRLTNLSPEQIERGKKRMWLMAVLGLLASMLVAYVMSYFGIAWQVYDIGGAINLGVWCWIGFAAPVMLGQVIWDQKPLRLYLINALYWLVAFVVMAMILLYTSLLINPGASANDQGDSTYVTSE